MEENPYQTPAASIGGSQSIGTGDGVTREVVDQLARTRPWTLFLSILGFVGIGFMVLGSIMAIASASSIGQGSIGVVIGLVYLAMAAIYALPCIRLIQYSGAITQLRISPTTRSLEDALDKQRSFWKTVGIMTLISIVLTVVLVIAQIAAFKSTSETYYYR